MALKNVPDLISPQQTSQSSLKFVPDLAVPTTGQPTGQSTGQTVAERFSSEGLAGKVADVTNLSWEGFSNLPVLKQASQVIGGASAVVGGAIGGGLAAIMSPVKSILLGQSITKNWWKDVSQTARQTGEFGYSIGKGGAVAGAGAIGIETLAAGGALASAASVSLTGLTGYGMTYSGFREWNEAKDPVQKAEAATQIVGGLLAFYGLGKEIVPKAKAPAEPVKIEAPTEIKNTAQDFVHKQALEHNTRLLRQTGLEMTKESRAGKNTADFLTNDGVILKAKKGPDGKWVNDFESTIAVQKMVETVENNAMSKVFTEDPRYFDITEARQKMLNKIDTPVERAKGEEFLQKQDYINRKMDALEEANQGHITTTNGKKLVDSTQFNFMRRGFDSSVNWKTKESFLNQTDYLMADTARDMLRSAYKDSIDNEMINKTLGSRIEAIRLLERKNNQRVTVGGRPTRFLASLIGLSHGKTLPGKIVNVFLGGHIADILNNPNIKGGALEFYLERNAYQPKSQEVLQYIQKYLENNQKQQSSRLLLPEPNSIRMGPKTPPESRLLSQEEAQSKLGVSGQPAQQTARPGQPQLPPGPEGGVIQAPGQVQAPETTFEPPASVIGGVGQKTITDLSLDEIISGLESGGVTFDWLKQQSVGGEPLIAVSPFPERSLITDSKPTKQMIVDYIKQNSDLLEKDGFTLGGWYDTESGQTFMDVTVTIPKENQQAAIDLAKTTNQKAVFDLQNFEEINTGGTGEATQTLPTFEERLKQATEALDSPVKTEVQRRLSELAPTAKKEIDSLVEQTAKQFEGARLAEAPLKGEDRAVQKVVEDYGGNVDQLTDLARNTLVVKNSDFQAAFDSIASDPNVVKSKIIDSNTDALGYSGGNIKYKTSNGLVAEIQVNSPEMIFAKEREETARAILGNDVYEQIAEKTGMEGGLGHKFYEQFRVLKDKTTEEALQIIEASKQYYQQIRDLSDLTKGT